MDYFPIELGNSWTFLEDGTTTTTTLVLPVQEEVRGAETFVLEEFGGPNSGSTQNLTNDAEGLRLHKLVAVQPGDPDITAIFSPPLGLLDAAFDVGEVNTHRGDARFQIAGVGTFNVNYRGSSAVVGLEEVNVPFGTFETVRVDSTFTLFGVAAGQFLSVTTSGSDWFAPGVGAVRGTAVAEGRSIVSELVDTNVVPEPDDCTTLVCAFLVLAPLLTSRVRTRELPSA